MVNVAYAINANNFMIAKNRFSTVEIGKSKIEFKLHYTAV